MIYLDHHATTPLDPRVLAAMMPYLTGKFGNAASRSHAFGWEAEQAVEEARKQVARLIGAIAAKRLSSPAARPSRITWRSKACGRPMPRQGDHVITCAIEHKAVLDACQSLERRGAAYDPAAGRPRRAGRSRRGGRGHRRPHRTGLDHVREQRSGHPSAGGRDRPDLPRARRACSIATPRRPSARCP